MKESSDEQILQGLKSSNQQVANKALNDLYLREYPVISRFVHNNNGDNEDAADLFQDAIIVFYEKVRLNKVDLSCTIRTYLYSICKHLWLNKLRNRREHLSVHEEDIQTIPISTANFDVLIEDERNELLGRLLDHLGKDCKKVLNLYYFKRIRMKEIANILNLSNEQGAKNKKSRCLKKLKTLIEGSTELQNRLK